MPHATAESLPLGQGLSDYTWVQDNDRSHVMTRKLANLERMFAIFNQNMHGQNCPFLGLSVSVQRSNEQTSNHTPLNISRLHARALTAFEQTRWKYPTVAARLTGTDQVTYHLESTEDVKKWTDRTIFTVCQDGGWRALRDQLSRTSSLPTVHGDCCLFYLVIRPQETMKREIDEFDILMHTHHTLVDGSAIRVILNEFLSRLVDPTPDQDIIWGREIDRLLPAAVVLEKNEAGSISQDVSQVPVNPEKRLAAFNKPDVGLPVYRPDLVRLRPDHKGSLLVSHTFSDTAFLPKLLSAGRKNKVKLTGLLHAALLKAVYESSEIKPGPEDAYQSGSPMDLRNGYLQQKYCDRTRYVNSAVAIQQIRVPCHFFDPSINGDLDSLWKAAAHIGDQWDTTKQKKGLARTVEADAKGMIEAIANARKNPSSSPPKPRTCPTFSSDPPGSQGLQGVYTIPASAGHGEATSLVIKSYQLATDQMQAVVSARSHSWNGLLTLCLVFNAIKNPKDRMQEVLDRWVNNVSSMSVLHSTSSPSAALSPEYPPTTSDTTTTTPNGTSDTEAATPAHVITTSLTSDKSTNGNDNTHISIPTSTNNDNRNETPVPSAVN